MERESGRLSALYLVGQLREELDRLNAQTSDGEAIASEARLIPNGEAYEQHAHYVDSRDHDEVSGWCNRLFQVSSGLDWLWLCET